MKTTTAIKEIEHNGKGMAYMPSREPEYAPKARGLLQRLRGFYAGEEEWWRKQRKGIGIALCEVNFV